MRSVEPRSAATNGIAAAVDGASHAAGQTASSLDRVTGAADRCYQAASSMHAISDGVADHMAGLKLSLAELLRSRIAELDRRASARHAIRLPARLEHPGGVAQCELRDLSIGGACLVGLSAGLEGGRLLVAGLPPVQVRVVGTSDVGTHTSFSFVSASDESEMAAAIEKLSARQQAA